MSVKWAFIEANDMLMFRDSKPFVRGSNFSARSTFPPHPRTMQGFVRTHILEMSGVDFAAFGAGQSAPLIHEVVGTSDSFGALRLYGPLVAQQSPTGTVESLFRTPLDLLIEKEAGTLSILQPSNQMQFAGNMPFNGWHPLMRKVGDSEPSQEADGWLSEADFAAYLNGEPLGKVVKDDSLFDTELRVGLGIDYTTRRGIDSQFYHAEFIRLAISPVKTGILVGVENDQGLFIEGSGFLGGEGRTAQVTLVDYTPVNLVEATEGRVKLVLLTPAWFENGWSPANNDWSPWVEGGRLVALAVGKPQLISGWDLARQQPRPIRHFVPAGSVFYFEDASLTGKAFTEQPVNENGYAEMGFGLYASGSWDYLD